MVLIDEDGVMPDSPLLQLPNTFRGFYGGFPGLHRVQKEAAAPILGGYDLVIQAATGSGKSEAVLAPCLERVIQSGRTTAVLYIIPTRALAMDLKRRFETIITERLGLNLAVRTGDVKRSGGKSPDIMITTPESLDVMLGSANNDLKRFLFRVGMVIIDEVHSFLFQYRGRHLVYLFTRLERRTNRPLQKIAMSATIAGPGDVVDFFKFQPSARSIVTNVKRTIKARLIQIKQEKTEIPALVNDLYEVWHYRKILIFVNSRVACDRVFAIVNETGRFKGVSELHYSNLKPLERKRAETRFRKRPHALCIATSTLELGIDVGDVDAVLLYQPPGSVSAFLQRIGRANRRENRVNFWGICAGEQSEDQLIRFLALLELSQQGRIESHPGRSLPSVLSQQVISCLYEKKRISLPALHSLFPDQENTLDSVFDSLEKKHWLKPCEPLGMFGPGWQYGNHLIEYKIWGNFPEAEQDYVLEVSARPIADIPHSMVAQMEVGDKIYLAGRLLRILNIDKEDQKRVMARPARGRAEKQLAWVGLGPPVSYDVARAMGEIVNASEVKENPALFSRTRELLLKALGQSAKKVVLENGIEIVPGKTGQFRYRTFLGTMGNLVLEWSVREDLGEEDLVVSSDEMGVESSHEIRFEELNLPVDREGFLLWVRRHLKILRSLVSLNMFCKTLPEHLFVRELMDFLFDPRVVHTFAHYLESSSKIVSGDMATLFLGPGTLENSAPCSLDIECGQSLLAREREKSRVSGLEALADFFHGRIWGHPCADADNPGADTGAGITLTATMVSDYIFHGQCHRRFCLKFMDVEAPNPTSGPISGIESGPVDNPAHDPTHDLAHDPGELRNLFMERGKVHERAVLQELRNRGAAIISMETNLSIESRFNALLDLIRSLPTRSVAHAGKETHLFLSQGLIKVEDLDLDDPGLNGPGQENLKMDGVGVPDLLFLSIKEEDGKTKVLIQVGDIKSSLSPGYHHKWQVAFYALVLEKLVSLHGIPAMVAETGFVITGKSETAIGYIDPAKSGKTGQTKSHLQELFSPAFCLYDIHEFNLKPYISAFPALFNTFHSILSNPYAMADHKLGPGCVACDWFPFCYQTALKNEEIQFLPGLTQGQLLKLRQMGCKTMAELAGTLGEMESEIPLEQKKELLGKCTAFFENKIFLKRKNTRLFPNNISYAFFVHLIKNPLTKEPRALGFQVMDPNGRPVECRVWTMEGGRGEAKGQTNGQIDDQTKNHAEAQTEIVRDFMDQISLAWKKSISHARGPHLFCFGNGTIQDLFQWLKNGAGENFKVPGQALPDAGKTQKIGSRVNHWTNPPTNHCANPWAGQSAGQSAGQMVNQMVNHWTDLQRVFTDHFYLPAPGVVSLCTLAHLFGLEPTLDPPQTLFHFYGDSGLNNSLSCTGESENQDKGSTPLESTLKANLSAMANLYDKARFYLNPQGGKEWESEEKNDSWARLLPYLNFIKVEQRMQEENILTLQELTLDERILRFRAIGYLRFDHKRLDHEGRFLHVFKSTIRSLPSKFRRGDFLKLAPHGLADLQTGLPVILVELDLAEETVSLVSRSGKLAISQHLLYSLEEDSSDWNQEKLTHVATAIFKGDQPHFLEQLLPGKALDRQPSNALSWLETWLANKEHGLNSSQQQALALPFKYRTTMIQGPPGTGKTHLLGWILIALIIQAHEAGRPLRIGVSALTHKAIDNALKKVTKLANRYFPGRFPGQCIKWGKPQETEETEETENREGPEDTEDRKHTEGMDGHGTDREKTGKPIFLEFSDDPTAISDHPWLILGATGYGFYKLFNSKNKGFPQALDWVIFDEASQVPIPQALLTLIYGKGNFLLLGDVHQLPPIVRGSHGENQGGEVLKDPEKKVENDSGEKPYFTRQEPNLSRSILANFLDLYPEFHQKTLDTTYRMNKEICAFPGKTWYRSMLHPAESNAHARLLLNTPPDWAGRSETGALQMVEHSFPPRLRHLGDIYSKGPYPGYELDRILDPKKPIVLVMMDHHGCSQKSEMEAHLVAALAHRLMTFHGISADRMALISPHRAQNNAILKRVEDLMQKSLKESLKDSAKALAGEIKGSGPQDFHLPCVDTVERVQGAERDIIIFGMTSSDPDHLSSEFLNSPNRLNVAMTRAKTKLIILGSNAFFSVIPQSESLLEKNACFKELVRHCRNQDAVFTVPFKDAQK